MSIKIYFYDFCYEISPLDFQKITVGVCTDISHFRKIYVDSLWMNFTFSENYGKTLCWNFAFSEIPVVHFTISENMKTSDFGF